MMIFVNTKKTLLSFWRQYLDTSLVPNAMSDLVIKILSVPVGSADAERAFSTFSISGTSVERD